LQPDPVSLTPFPSCSLTPFPGFWENGAGIWWNRLALAL